MYVRVVSLFSMLAFMLLISGAFGQPYNVGANLGVGATVTLPEGEAVTGEKIKPGVPTLVIFAQVEGCNLCGAVGDMASEWIRKYPNVQVFVVETRSLRPAVAAWAEKNDVPIVYDATVQFRKAFDTNLTLVYLLDEQGKIREKVRPQYRRQWVELDRQLERANRGAWDEVDANSVALPSIGQPGHGSASVPIPGSGPTVVLVSDGLCSYCQEVLGAGLQAALNDLVKAHPEVSIYLLEPSQESLKEGFIGTPSLDYGPRDIFEEYVKLFGEEAAGDEITNYLNTGELRYGVPVPFWPEKGWASGITQVRYDIGSPDDPVSAWNYGEKQLGLLIFAADGTFLGPTPLFFTGQDGKALAGKVKRTLGLTD